MEQSKRGISMAKSAGERNSRARQALARGCVLGAVLSADLAIAAARLRTKPTASGASPASAPATSKVLTATPLATVAQFNGTPFLHEAKWLKGTTPNPRRRTEDAIYNGRRTRVIRLENDLPLFDGDSIETPGDASMELAFLTGDRWLVHPGSLVELRDSPAVMVLGRGRVTLLVASGGSPALPVESRGTRFEGLVTGAFVDFGETEATQGNDLRAQEFVGFDDLALVPPVDSTASDPSPAPGQALKPNPPARVRDENPLDDVGEEESNQQRPAVTAPAAPSEGTDTLERGRVFLALGKVVDTSGDALARKVWSLHGGALAWFSRGLAAEIAFDVLPRVSATAGGLPFAHQRGNGSLGLRLSPATRAPVRFFVTPLVGVVSLKGTLAVGAARDGSSVHSGVSVGPNFVYGLRTGADASFGAVDLGLLGHLAVRYSSDKVSLRHAFIEGKVGYAFTGGDADPRTARTSGFLFARYEDFLTEKDLGPLGRKDIEIGWSLLGGGISVAF